MSEELGFSQGPVDGQRAQSVTFSSDSPVYLFADEQNLEVILRGLPIRSRNGTLGSLSQTISSIPRLLRINNGQLHYTPGYSQPVSIPYSYDTAINSRSVEVRTAEGKLADLGGTITVALRFW